MSYLPLKNIGEPNGVSPTPPPPPITPTTPIYSSYTQQFVQFGQILKGTISDDLPGGKNHNKPFHVVEYNPANESYMVHRQTPLFNPHKFSSTTVHPSGYVTGAGSYGYFN
ncbi:MAG: hypothetical protein Homavirus11_4 [Homavirus sp.]|uniref:Uncharacterized protein n=1 Tax=Homavirus sp. TaxID=2487769 RepID=A0A3G5A4L1_9VIRU|nr:MAG: hypothetical protein Homavirus11_4 [Homavirus sp.]